MVVLLQYLQRQAFNTVVSSAPHVSRHNFTHPDSPPSWLPPSGTLRGHRTVGSVHPQTIASPRLFFSDRLLQFAVLTRRPASACRWPRDSSVLVDPGGACALFLQLWHRFRLLLVSFPVSASRSLLYFYFIELISLGH